MVSGGLERTIGLYEEGSDETRWEKGRVATLQARDSDGMLVADNAVGALLTADGKAVVVHYGWSKKMSTVAVLATSSLSAMCM